MKVSELLLPVGVKVVHDSNLKVLVFHTQQELGYFLVEARTLNTKASHTAKKRGTC